MATSRRGSRTSKTVVTADQYFFPVDIPDVVGMTRLDAIQALTYAGVDYLVVYTGSGATAKNNDIVSSQVNDGISTIYVYQYVSSLYSISFNNGARAGVYSQIQDPQQLDGKVTGDVPVMSDVSPGTIITIPGGGNLVQTEISLTFFNGQMSSSTVYATFVGWSDGSRLYRENDSYTVNSNTNFKAIWRSSVMAPGITSVTPDTASVGNTLTIVGSGLGGTTQVKFNRNKIAQFTIIDDTIIEATVPIGATTGNIVISNGNGIGIYWIDII
jgi:hypothetical protein